MKRAALILLSILSTSALSVNAWERTYTTENARGGYDYETWNIDRGTYEWGTVRQIRPGQYVRESFSNDYSGRRLGDLYQPFDLTRVED